MAKRTLLDRTIVTILPNSDDDTPSRKDGVSMETERLYRIHGITIMEDACRILKINKKCFPTAATIFHRFLHQTSLKSCNVWSIAMACTVLAAKTEEVTLPVRQAILAYVHIYRRRATYPSKEPVAAFCEKQEDWLEKVPPLSQLGPLWKDWHDAFVQAESCVLRQLGFVMYWIPDQHPHRFVPHFVKALQCDDDSDILSVEAVYEYCNLSFRLDLCVRYEPEVIACAAIQIAAWDQQLVLPVIHHKPWWEVFCGAGRDLATLCNAILGLQDDENVGLASRAFLKPLEPDGSFNGPTSFVWEQMIEEH